MEEAPEELISKTIRSLSELDSMEAFTCLVVIPIHGTALQPISWNGSASLGNKVTWMEAGFDGYLTSMEIISTWMSNTDEPFEARLIDLVE